MRKSVFWQSQRSRLRPLELETRSRIDLLSVRVERIEQRPTNADVTGARPELKFLQPIGYLGTALSSGAMTWACNDCRESTKRTRIRQLGVRTKLELSVNKNSVGEFCIGVDGRRFRMKCVSLDRPANWSVNPFPFTDVNQITTIRFWFDSTDPDYVDGVGPDGGGSFAAISVRTEANTIFLGSGLLGLAARRRHKNRS
jgi:hypothetical protein